MDQIFKELKIIEKVMITHNVVKIVLKYENKLPEMIVSSFVFIYDDNANYRPYTPLKILSDTTMEFAIKVYQNGLLSRYINSRPLGSFLKVKFFIKKLSYEHNKYNHILMISGGTGITPCIQVLNSALVNENKTKFTLLNFNKTENDVFCKEYFNEYEKSGKFNLINVYTQDNSIPYKGHFTKEMFEKINKEFGEFDFVYVCGPQKMMKEVSGNKNPDKSQGSILGVLSEIGFSNKNVYKF
ncbi:MCR1 [Hepatospora eriocheir]|uniref:MCR1 n=1 Tax=Hepatospora eriocheir TaxID=1081669 RepID=A0A1X0QEF0_9MICR|nr:MCR1 [Hepatospora eriocheir]